MDQPAEAVTDRLFVPARWLNIGRFFCPSDIVAIAQKNLSSSSHHERSICCCRMANRRR